ncbi:MAG: hypothetical protein PVH31_04955 [Ectothiorhodospiraceae bacterium]|jgi:ribosomal 50S subunit-recycling heat shock protein
MHHRPNLCRRVHADPVLTPAGSPYTVAVGDLVQLHGKEARIEVRVTRVDDDDKLEGIVRSTSSETGNRRTPSSTVRQGQMLEFTSRDVWYCLDVGR